MKNNMNILILINYQVYKIQQKQQNQIIDNIQRI